MVYLTRLFTRLYRTTHRITRTKVSAMNTYLSENLSAMKLIQLFHRENEKHREFTQRSADLFQSNFREIVVYGTFRPLIYFISILSLASVLGFGGVQVMHGALSIGTLYIFTSYVKSFFEPIQSLSDQFGTLQAAMAAGEKIFTLMDEEPLIHQPEHPKALSSPKGRIVFDHVWFSYDGEEWVLRDVSFVIEPGQTVAFVGATGAGKSSILNLIGRYYDIQKGKITIDGIDIRELDIHALRRAVGQVQQDVFLFTGDIQSNIRLRESSITDGQIRSAAKFVNADGFIAQLEQGYETAVTERGSTLSAGQRQLLSFARTLAFDPAILVMDEATANIDTETEMLIQDAMERLMQGRTTIVVAHRLSTIQHADKIMVMHKGRLREEGTHPGNFFSPRMASTRSSTTSSSGLRHKLCPEEPTRLVPRGLFSPMSSRSKKSSINVCVVGSDIGNDIYIFLLILIVIHTPQISGMPSAPAEFTLARSSGAFLSSQCMVRYPAAASATCFAAAFSSCSIIRWQALGTMVSLPAASQNAAVCAQKAFGNPAITLTSSRSICAAGIPAAR